MIVHRIRALQLAIELLYTDQLEVMMQLGLPLKHYNPMSSIDVTQVADTCKRYADQGDFNFAMFLANVGVEWWRRGTDAYRHYLPEKNAAVLNVLEPRFSIFAQFIMNMSTGAGTDACGKIVKLMENQALKEGMARWMDVCTAVRCWDANLDKPHQPDKVDIEQRFCEFYFPFEIELVGRPGSPSRKRG